MTGSHEDRAKAIFEAVVDLPPERRAKKIADLCKGADDLKRSVEALIASDESATAEGFLAAPAVQRPTTATSGLSVGERPGDMIGPYKLLQVIGEGGFGVVFMAEQKEPVKRRVALKIIKHGMDTKQVIARFEAERQALALMDHPNIARVLDGGATEKGRPYFVMDLVRGVEITEYCDENRLDVRERLALFADVCRAVQHAHQKGVIHRDLKPSNVLVTLHDGRPVPIVIDFGIAKATNTELTNKTLFTEYGQMIGTPAYMSPEQAEMSGLDVDTRSDVYSLGVLLYELLTGTTPLDMKDLRERGFLELLQAIKDSEPQRPSTRVSTARTAASTAAVRRSDPGKLGALLRGDLDWIVMRCLEKDRARRYESAASLAADVERHLAGEIVEAVPPSRAYRLRKLVRRHRGAVAAVTLVAVVLVLGVAGTTIGMTRAINEAARAERELARATEVGEIVRSMLLGVTPEQARGADTTLLRSVLDDTAERLESGEIEDELIEAELRLLVGRTYTSLAAYEPAEHHLSRALAIRKRLLGKDADETIAVREAISGMLLGWGRFTELVEHEEVLLEDVRRLHGDEDERVLDARLRLGSAYWQAGRDEEAEAALRDVLHDARARLGDDAAKTLVCMTNLAGSLEALGRTKDAVELLRTVVGARRRKFGDDHPATLSATSNLAAGLGRLGHYEEAAELMTGLVAAQDRISGRDHPHTMAARIAHAKLLVQLGRTSEAEEELLVVREAAERTLDPEHHMRFGVEIELADVYVRQGRMDETVDAVQRAAETARRTLGAGDERLPDLLSRAGEACARVQRYDVAHRLRSEAYDLLVERLGPDHARSVEVRLSRDANATQIGKAAEVEPGIRELRERLEATLGGEHPLTLKATGVLADAAAEQGRWDEAEPLYREVLAAPDLDPRIRQWMHGALISLLRRSGRPTDAERELGATIAWLTDLHGPDALDVFLNRRELAAVVRVQGRHEDACALLEETRADMREAMGAEHPLVLETECHYAVELGALKRLDEAEALLLDVKARLERTLGLDHAVSVILHVNLGRVYTDMNRPEDAARCWETAVAIEERIDGLPGYQNLDLLAGHHARTGDHARAAELYRRAARAVVAKHGERHAARALFLFRLALQLEAQKNLSGAATALETALEVAELSLPPDHQLRRDILGAALRIRHTQRLPAKKIPLLEALVELDGGLGPDATPQALQAAPQLAMALSEVGRFADAERVREEALATARSLMGSRNPLVGLLEVSGALAAHRSGAWDEATAAFTESASIFEALGGPDALLRVITLVGCAEARLDSGDPDGALELLETLRPTARRVQQPGVMIANDIDALLIRIYADRDRIEDARRLLGPVIEHYESSLAGEPYDRNAPTSLAKLLLHDWSPDTYSPERALEMARRGVALQAEAEMISRWQAAVVLARAQHANGQTADARETLRLAREVAPPGRRAEVDRAADELQW